MSNAQPLLVKPWMRMPLLIKAHNALLVQVEAIVLFVWGVAYICGSLGLENKRAIPVEKLVNIQISPILKKQLVDDFEFITHLGKVKDIKFKNGYATNRNTFG
eukprot:XP_019075505.1 PREDICTED: uncharacterized protein LOC104879322 [Vitis vinifera]